MLTLEEARETLAQEVAQVLDGASRTTETVSLAEANGRRLAEDIIAPHDQPQSASASMDGYCLRASDCAGASPESPVLLSLTGEQAAGAQISTLAPRTARRIFTGGLLPQGADSVLIQEEAERVGDQLRLSQEVAAGAWVRQQGRDFAKGETLLREGQLLTPRGVALLASANRAEVAVLPRVKVALLASGDELVAPASLAEVPPHKVVASSRPALSALLTSWGVSLTLLPIAPDDKRAIAGAVNKVRQSDADILLTCGGASVGDYDCLRPALQELGWRAWFHKVAVRPGMPVFAGALKRESKKPALVVLGVPGNPVSSYVSCLLFLRPLLALFAGAPLPALRFCRVQLADALESENGARHSFLRARLDPQEQAGEPPLVRVAQDQDSSLIKTLAQADFLLSRPPHDPAHPAGAILDALSLEKL